MRGVVTAVISVLWALPLGAQTTLTGGNTNATITGNLLINIAAADEACTGTPPEVTFTLTEIAGTTPPVPLFDAFGSPLDQTLYVWWDTESSNCTDIPATVVAGPQALDDTDGIVKDGTFRFPQDLDGDVEFTELTVLEEFAACGATEDLQSEQKKLCLGVDSDDGTGTGVDKIQELTEYFGWILFEVDTASPPLPNAPNITPLDGALQIGASFAETGETDDVTMWLIRYLPDDGSGTTTCNDSFESRTISAPTGDPNFQLAGLQNGQTYLVCIAAEDDAGNAGSFSAGAIGTPRDECDFAECYPGGFPSGFCGAGSSALAPLGVVAVLARRRQRRSASGRSA